MGVVDMGYSVILVYSMGWLERLEGWRGRSRVGVGKLEGGRYIGLVIQGCFAKSLSLYLISKLQPR